MLLMLSIHVEFAGFNLYVASVVLAICWTGGFSGLARSAISQDNQAIEEQVSEG